MEPVNEQNFGLFLLSVPLNTSLLVGLQRDATNGWIGPEIKD